jgi:hypothetical protein
MAVTVTVERALGDDEAVVDARLVIERDGDITIVWTPCGVDVDDDIVLASLPSSITEVRRDAEEVEDGEMEEDRAIHIAEPANVLVYKPDVVVVEVEVVAGSNPLMLDGVDREEVEVAVSEGKPEHHGKVEVDAEVVDISLAASWSSMTSVKNTQPDCQSQGWKAMQLQENSHQDAPDVVGWDASDSLGRLSVRLLSCLFA